MDPDVGLVGGQTARDLGVGRGADQLVDGGDVQSAGADLPGTTTSTAPALVVAVSRPAVSGAMWVVRPRSRSAAAGPSRRRSRASWGASGASVRRVTEWEP
ncbi:hypothetical protein [Streptomyces sp. NPDC091294]|uniref:hypothetical protein n=1 Tax=Streptomyces sp. NPDC091294 TaxID=3365992 RepID=UPI00381FBECC